MKRSEAEAAETLRNRVERHSVFALVLTTCVRRPALLLFVLFPFAVGQARGADDPPKHLTIVAFGDSTTAVRRTVKLVYADRLPQLLSAEGIRAKVINAGVGGSHTGRLADNARHKRRHALDRFDDAVRKHTPDVVVIQFGWNDSWVDSDEPSAPSRITVKQYAANLAFMVDTLEKDGARVILLTPNRPRSTVEPWRVERTTRYVQAVRRLAKSKSIPLVDVWEEYARLDALPGRSADELLLDAVHPNDKGHALVAKMLATAIKAAKSESPTQGK